MYAVREWTARESMVGLKDTRKWGSANAFLVNSQVAVVFRLLMQDAPPVKTASDVAGGVIWVCSGLFR